MAAPSTQHVKRPGVGIGVIVTNDKYPNHILLGRRKGSAGSGSLALPGGHMEFGEEWVDCAKREVKEETGLTLKNVVFWTVVNAVCLEQDYHYVTIFMRGEVDPAHKTEPENREPQKCEGWEWTDWDKFPPAEQLFWPLRLVREQGQNPFTPTA